jgi:hypothetical protein
MPRGSGGGASRSTRALSRHLSGAKTGPNPTDRAKLGTKRHILTYQRGTLLSALITGANVHDMKAAMDTLDGIVVQRRLGTFGWFFLALADLPAIDHDVVLVSDPINADGAKEKRFEAHHTFSGFRTLPLSIKSVLLNSFRAKSANT